MKMDIIAISVEMVGNPPSGYVSGGYGPPSGAEKTRPPPKIIAMTVEGRIRKWKKKENEHRQKTMRRQQIRDDYPQESATDCSS
jgi:hypothetical protein